MKQSPCQMCSLHLCWRCRVQQAGSHTHTSGRSVWPWGRGFSTACGQRMVEGYMGAQGDGEPEPLPKGKRAWTGVGVSLWCCDRGIRTLENYYFWRLTKHIWKSVGVYVHFVSSDCMADTDLEYVIHRLPDNWTLLIKLWTIFIWFQQCEWSRFLNQWH